MAVLLISHDLNMVRQFSHTIHVMQSGRIIESNTTTALFQKPQQAETIALLKANQFDFDLDDIRDHQVVLNAKNLSVSYALTLLVCKKSVVNGTEVR